MYATRTILERLVLFDCTVCREVFPTFHPAYDPSQCVDLHLLRRGAHNVAALNLEVAKWDSVPPFEASAEELLVADMYEGTCWACHVDMKSQMEALGGNTQSIVPKRSHLNGMNPMHGFPGGGVGQDLRELFSKATVLEAMLVALEHMMVNYVSAKRTHLPKFIKNVISFPQDFPGFAARLGLLRQYQAGDWVNSVRGPPQEGEDEHRKPKSGREASLAEKERFGEDERGYLVFPAQVRGLTEDGRLVLDYEDSCGRAMGSGMELPENVSARIHMPWHPKFLKGQTKIMLQRDRRARSSVGLRGAPRARVDEVGAMAHGGTRRAVA